MQSTKLIMTLESNECRRLAKSNLFRLAFLLLALGAVSAHEEAIDKNVRKILTTSFCNVEFKQTFIDPDFNSLSNSPTQASKQIKKICPFTKFSCCTINELKDITTRYSQNMKILTDYFRKIQENLNTFSQIKFERLVRFFNKQTKEMKDDQILTGSKCVHGFSGTKKEAKTILFNLKSGIEWSIVELENVRNLLERFYSGFACSVCDLLDHQFVEVNDQDKTTSMTFDPNVCDTIFRIRVKHYRIVKYVMDLFDIANSLLCSSSRGYRNFVYFTKLRLELGRKTKAMEDCAVHSDNETNELSENCLNLCGEKLFFQLYIDNFDMLTLSNFVKNFLLSVRRGSLKRKAKKRMTHLLFYAVDFSFKESSKRRIFHLHQPKYQNLFSNEKFKRKFKSNGINFMNKAPVLATA